MKHLASINKYLWKYRVRLLLGIVFIVLSNYFRILSPQISGYIINKVEQHLSASAINKHTYQQYNVAVTAFINVIEDHNLSFKDIVIICGITLLVLALIGGIFMFLMRQTIIVMSRYIEYDQKNEVYNHYQQLDMHFYKTHNTGDLMNRITEDVSRVRMYTGPAVMYFINLIAAIGFSVYFMIQENWRLTLYVLSPLPVLAFTIYYVNTLINKRSERIQSLLSNLTTTAQESYSGIRVIKSFVQEKATKLFFDKNSEDYKNSAIGLAKVESIYFPAMGLLIGLSTLITIAVGGWYYIHHQYNVSAGTIAEFVLYINFITFPVSAIGWTASMVQRAAVSQRRLNEFLFTKPTIQDSKSNIIPVVFSNKNIVVENLNYVYQNTGIKALTNVNFQIKDGERVLLFGKTGSGKSTIAQLLLRFYNATEGHINIGDNNVQDIPVKQLRETIGFVPQDIFLFSDTVADNIGFGLNTSTRESVEKAALMAGVHKDIMGFKNQYDTMIGERGVTLSGGQKQRISIARALIKQPDIVILDDCLSAVDAKTEQEIIGHLDRFLTGKTAIIITHRIFTHLKFDKVIILENGAVKEIGTPDELLKTDNYYSQMYQLQMMKN